MAVLRVSPAPVPAGRRQDRLSTARPPAKLQISAGAHAADPLLSLPDLPTPLKEKILCMEMMGIDSGRALSLNPALRSTPLDSLHVIISFLLTKGIHHKDLARIFGMCPAALTAEPRRDLAPVFNFLAAELAVPSAAFRRVINKCPRLLVCSVPDQLIPALVFLKRLGFKDMEGLAYHDPVLLASSVEKTLLPKLEFLEREVGEGKEMVVRCPALFTFSVENNLRPKLGYLVEEMGRDVAEVREFPQYFAFSLEKRIKPRHRAMEERGLRLSLPTMLKTTDHEFGLLLQTADSSPTVGP
ncbi:mitochondrial transcription termination factor family protein [Wolffia australiana]